MKGEIDPETVQAVLTALSQNPIVQRLIQLASDPKLKELVMQIWNHPSRKYFVWMELAWPVLVLIMGTWWSSQGEGIFRAIGIKLVMTVLFFVGLWVGIPWLLFGDSFLNLVTLVWKYFQ